MDELAKTLKELNNTGQELNKSVMENTKATKEQTKLIKEHIIALEKYGANTVITNIGAVGTIQAGTLEVKQTLTHSRVSSDNYVTMQQRNNYGVEAAPENSNQQTSDETMEVE